MWPVLSPVVEDFAQSYCYKATCAVNSDAAFPPWLVPDTDRVGGIGEMAASRAYVSLLIGASICIDIGRDRL